MRIFLACIGLAGAVVVLTISLAEQRQEAALEKLSSYKADERVRPLGAEPDPKLITARSPYMRSERY